MTTADLPAAASAAAVNSAAATVADYATSPASSANSITAADAGSAAAASSASSPATSAPGPDEPGVDAPSRVAGARARIDAIDAELIALIRSRAAVSAEVQSARIAGGGRRLDLSRETEVIGRYTRSLGRPGTSVAMALLELGRGRV